MKNYNQLIHTRLDKSFNIIILITAIICFISAYFLSTAGFLRVYSLLNMGTGLILLVVFAMAKKIKTAHKIMVLIVLASIIALASYIGGSFSSPFITLLLLANLLAILFLELQTSIIISFLSLALMLGLATRPLLTDPFSSLVAPLITWALQIIAYLLFVITTHISIYVIKKYLLENIEDLENAMVKTNQLAYYD